MEKALNKLNKLVEAYDFGDALFIVSEIYRLNNDEVESLKAMYDEQ